MRPRSFLIFTQVYTPDTPAVGQYCADVATELARRGHTVTVYTSARSYEDPSIRFAARERVNGVEIRRLPLSSFGKGSLVVRMLAGVSFTVQCAIRGIFGSKPDVVLVSTAPPMIGLAGVVVAAVRRAELKFWVMDLNPDQAIAMGAVRANSLPARLLDWSIRAVLRHARDVIVLDRFMADRVQSKQALRGRLTVLPPWPLDDFLEIIPHEKNPFRREHGLEGRFVVMYSGNHTPANPINTALAAARELRDDARIVFLFVGGGSEKRLVEDANLPNVVSLPYEPLESLRYSLSAADLHLVTMGNDLVGIVHPSKIYSAMAVGRPVLILGPERSHLGDLARSREFGWRVEHGDVAGAVAAIREAASSPGLQARMGLSARTRVSADLGKQRLCGALSDVLEGASTPRKA